MIYRNVRQGSGFPRPPTRASPTLSLPGDDATSIITQTIDQEKSIEHRTINPQTTTIEPLESHDET
jgi:hypothetical protein